MSKTIKEQLQEIRHLNHTIALKQQQLDWLRATMDGLKAQVLSHDKVQSSKDPCKLNIVDKIIDLDREIDCDIGDLVDLKRYWMCRVKQLPLPERNVLEAYYLTHKNNGETLHWAEVCVLVGYEWAQTHRYHARALDLLAEKR